MLHMQLILGCSDTPVHGCSLKSQHKDAGTQETLCHQLQHTHVHPCNPEAEFWLQCYIWYVIIAETGFGIQGFYLALTLLILLYTQGKLTTLRNKTESWKFFNAVRDTDGEKANGNTAQRTIKNCSALWDSCTLCPPGC